MKWFRKNNLDEMQELKLLKIESRGFWIGFFGLFLTIAAQVVLYEPENINHTLNGEFIVFLCMAVYLIVGCLRNGIWDRHLQATPAVNIGLSLLAAAIVSLFNALLSYRNYRSISGAFAVFIVYFLMLSVVLSVTLCSCSALYHWRRKQLEEEKTDENDIEN